jgi:phage baseplate assembly protein W
MTKLTGISPKVPLIYDPTDGPYQLNKNLKQTINQNLKMLVLTSPGERIMIPEFGVGLRRFLFEQVGEETFSQY